MLGRRGRGQLRPGAQTAGLGRGVSSAPERDPPPDRWGANRCAPRPNTALRWRLGPPGSAAGMRHRGPRPFSVTAAPRLAGLRRSDKRGSGRPLARPPGPLPSSPARRPGPLWDGLEATPGGGRWRRERSCKSHDFPAYINHSLFFSTGCRLKGAVSSFSPKGRDAPGCF